MRRVWLRLCLALIVGMIGTMAGTAPLGHAREAPADGLVELQNPTPGARASPYPQTRPNHPLQQPKHPLAAVTLHSPALAAAVRYCVSPQDFTPTVRSLVGETLVRRVRDRHNKVARIAPGIAQTWAVSADGLTYRFVLPNLDHARPFHSVPWFNPANRVTSADVVHTLTRLRTQPTPLGRTLDHTIAFVQTDGMNQVVIQLRRRVPLLLELLADSEAMIRPAELAVKLFYADHFAQDDHLLVGTGAFQLAQRAYRNAVVLAPNPAAGLRHVRPDARLAVVVVRGMKARAQALRDGDCQMASSLEPSSARTIPHAPDGQHRYAEGLLYLAPRANHPTWSNPEVMRALDIILDRHALADSLAGQRSQRKVVHPQPAWSLVPRTDLILPTQTDRRLALAVLRRHVPKPVRVAVLIPQDPSPFLPDPHTVARWLHRELWPRGLQVHAYIADAWSFRRLVYAKKFDFLIGGWYLRAQQRTTVSYVNQVVQALGCDRRAAQPTAQLGTFEALEQTPFLLQALTTGDEVWGGIVRQWPMHGGRRYTVGAPALVQTGLRDGSWDGVQYCSAPLREFLAYSSSSTNDVWMAPQPAQDQYLQALLARVHMRSPLVALSFVQHRDIQVAKGVNPALVTAILGRLE